MNTIISHTPLGGTHLLLLFNHIRYLLASFFNDYNLFVLHLHLPCFFPVLLSEEFRLIFGFSKLLIQLIHFLRIFLILNIHML